MELKELFNKLETMNEHISDIRVLTAKIEMTCQENTRNLDEHMKRTALLEADQNKWKGIIIAVGIAATAFMTILQLGIQIWLRK